MAEERNHSNIIVRAAKAAVSLWSNLWVKVSLVSAGPLFLIFFILDSIGRWDVAVKIVPAIIAWSGTPYFKWAFVASLLVMLGVGIHKVIKAQTSGEARVAKVEARHDALWADELQKLKSTIEEANRLPLLVTRRAIAAEQREQNEALFEGATQAIANTRSLMERLRVLHPDEAEDNHFSSMDRQTVWELDTQLRSDLERLGARLGLVQQADQQIDGDFWTRRERRLGIQERFLEDLRRRAIANQNAMREVEREIDGFIIRRLS